MKKCTTYTLGKTVVSTTYDDQPDTDFYGSYGNEYKPGCIVRADRSFYEDHQDDEEYDPPTMSREYSYFYPADNGCEFSTDEYKKYALQDYKRLENLGNTWSYIIVTVTTRIHTDTGISDNVHNSSCGVESEYGKENGDYRNEIVKDLISENTHELLKMGFSSDEIKTSTDNPVFPKDW